MVIVGRGIGHNKKRGEEITLADVDQMFLMTNKNLFPNIENLLTSVSTDLIITSNEIINYGKQKLSHSLNQNIIITLTDHLDYAISRARDGFTTPNPLNWDIKRFYPSEYEIGLYALKVVKKVQFTVLPEDEAGFIAMHFVDASLENGQNYNVTTLTRVIKSVMQVVDKQLPNIDRNSVSYNRFIRHVQYMAFRILDNATTSGIKDLDIMHLVFAKYPYEYSIAKNIQKSILKEFDASLNDSELMYITMHLARLLDK